MRVISKKILITFWTKHPDAEQGLKAWYEEAINANWLTPQSIKDRYKSASFLGKNRVVFNICGNKYRLIVAIAYKFGAIYVKFIGTHKEYDKVNAESIG